MKTKKSNEKIEEESRERVIMIKILMIGEKRGRRREWKRRREGK